MRWWLVGVGWVVGRHGTVLACQLGCASSWEKLCGSCVLISIDPIHRRLLQTVVSARSAAGVGCAMQRLQLRGISAR